MLIKKQLPSSYDYFDNYFASQNLLAALKLKEREIHATCTMRADRMRTCPLSKENDLKKKGIGSFDFSCDRYTVVAVTSNVHSVEPTHRVKRYSISI